MQYILWMKLCSCMQENKSSVHWDLIDDMKDEGKIFADGKLIYKNGYFLI